MPVGDAQQQQDRDEGERGEGEHRELPVRHDDERRHQRPERLAEIAADLEQALREAVTPPEAARATREASGWKIALPTPISATEPSSIA